MKDGNDRSPGADLNPKWRELNAFTHLDPKIEVTPDGVPESADILDSRRPLTHLRLAVKDNIEVADMPCTCGTPSLRNYVPTADAAAVALLRAAGAAIIGKTNMHELAYGITSNNAAFGPVRNVFDPNCFAGGSSGGTAAAIAAGVVRAGLGTDTGGSSRIPAALNGIVGFRPSVGRYPMAGVARISPTRDVIGPMGREVRDVALLDAVLCGAAARLMPAAIQGLRIGLPAEYFQESLHPDTQRALYHVIEVLRDAGVVFVAADLPDIAARNAAVSFPVALGETKGALQGYLRQTGLDLGLSQLHAQIASPDVKEIIGAVLADAISEDQYRHALSIERPRLQQLYKSYFAAHRVEAILFPTTPLPACPLEGSDRTVTLNGREVPTFATFIRNTDPASNAGIPGISLPAGFSLPSGVNARCMPIGIELDAPATHDRRLLEIAAAIEAALLDDTTRP